MTSIMNIKFEKLLSRKDFDSLITEMSPYNKAMIIRPFLINYVQQNDDNYYYTIVSKLYYDSLQALHEDSIELLKLKHKGKYNYFQTNKAIEEFLPQITCLIPPQNISEIMSESDLETTDISLVTETQKPAVKKPIKKKKTTKSTAEGDKKFIENFQNEYAPVDEDLMDDDEINKVFFN